MVDAALYLPRHLHVRRRLLRGGVHVEVRVARLRLPLLARHERPDPAKLPHHRVLRGARLRVARVRVGVDVVDVPDVQVVRPAARVSVNKAGRVELFGEGDDAGDVEGFGLENGPAVALVERLPLDDARVVAAAAHHGFEVGDEEWDRFGRWGGGGWGEDRERMGRG